jgi:hypothetical protein
MNICQTEKKQLGIIAEKEAKVIAGQQKIDGKQLQKHKKGEAIAGKQTIDEKQLQKHTLKRKPLQDRRNR